MRRAASYPAIAFRLAVAAVAFSALRATLGRDFQYALQAQYIRLLERAGVQVTRISGQLLYDADGPHMDAPVWLRRSCRYVPAAIEPLPPFFLAWLAFNARPFRSPARDGFTRCGFCNHILHGLSEPRCPECGRSI